MVLRKDIHHPNDVMNKFFENVMPEKLKNYFKLPGKFIISMQEYHDFF